MPTSCPFCKTALGVGANTCDHCGARYGYDPNRALNPFVRLGLVALPVVVVAGILDATLGNEAGALAVTAGAAGLAFFTRRSVRKHWWRRI